MRSLALRHTLGRSPLRLRSPEGPLLPAIFTARRIAELRGLPRLLRLRVQRQPGASRYRTQRSAAAHRHRRVPLDERHDLQSGDLRQLLPAVTGGFGRYIPFVLMALATPSVFYCAAPVLRIAWNGLRAGVLRMESLLAMGILAAYGYSAAQTFAGSTMFISIRPAPSSRWCWPARPSSAAPKRRPPALHRALSSDAQQSAPGDRRRRALRFPRGPARRGGLPREAR